MASNGSEPPGGPGPSGADALVDTAAAAVKIAVVGNLGVGKTTLVTSVSEIKPLTTEETMTRASIGVDDVSRVPSKTTTTVAMDFGRISLDERLVLYLFGTPGQERFWFLWDGLVDGALGAVVLADARRLADCFDVLDRLEKRGVPFIVAVNDFPGAPIHPVERLRGALDLHASVPIMHCDARVRASSRDVLLTLSRYLLELSRKADAMRAADCAAMFEPESELESDAGEGGAVGDDGKGDRGEGEENEEGEGTGLVLHSYRDLILDAAERAGRD